METNSPLVDYTLFSPNNSGKRILAIDRITPHCVVGQCSVESLGNLFSQASRQGSSNYGIGVDGRVGMYVEEQNRSWCSSSSANDQRAVTIECASDTRHPYEMKPVVYDKLKLLCIDICKRHGKKKLLWIPDRLEALSYTPKTDEMLITVHRWFANRECPGEWLYSRLGELSAYVTKALSGSDNTKDFTVETFYKVQVGCFKQKRNAELLVKQLREAGFEDAYIAEVTRSTPDAVVC